MKTADMYSVTDRNRVVAEVQLAVRHGDHHIGTFYFAASFPATIYADQAEEGAEPDPDKIRDLHIAINGRLHDVAMAVHEQLAALVRERA